MCTKAKPGRRDVLNNRRYGPILNSSWLCLPGKWNVSIQPRFQPLHAQFSQDTAAHSCLFPNQVHCTAHCGLKGHRGLQEPGDNTKLNPGTEHGTAFCSQSQGHTKQHENVCPSSHSASSLQPWTCLPCPPRFSLLWRFSHPSNISLIWVFKIII